MTSEPALEICSSLSEADQFEERHVMMAKRFVDFMDNYEGWSSCVLSENAVMDWFGRSLLGCASILRFLRMNIPRTHHIIETVTKITPINHRFLKNFKMESTPLQTPSKPLTEECGQGDCKSLSTPESTVGPNLKELVKAPKIKRFNSSLVGLDKCQFLEIKGRLNFDNQSTIGMFHMPDKKLERIVLGYTDEIHMVVYEGKSKCRRRLF